MKNHAVICTRSEEHSDDLIKLIEFFKKCDFKNVEVIVNGDSIFKSYADAVKKINPSNKEIIVFCHDDIEILSNPKQFNFTLQQSLLNKKTGFVGIAGTKILASNACWWDYSTLQAGKGSGLVIHGEELRPTQPTFYGPFGDVAVLDGVFLAATGRTLKKLDLNKPDYLSANWDFYDIHYTFEAYKLGLTNKTIPIYVRHGSSGMGAIQPGGGWNKNREAFVKKYRELLPIGEIPSVSGKNAIAPPKEASPGVSFVKT